MPPDSLQTLLTQFSVLFNNKVWEIKDMKAELHLEQDATFIFCKFRTVTYALRTSINEELLGLQNEGIIKPVSRGNCAIPIAQLSMW